jgi:hypothetical protein
MRRWFIRCFVPVLGLVIGVLAWRAWTALTEDAGPAGFRVGEETTFITGPLDEDGNLDFVAALNERLGKGIKPENNANVLLWQAMGPHPEGARMSPTFFKLLGSEPPEKGDYFVGWTQYLAKTRAAPPPGVGVGLPIPEGDVDPTPEEQAAKRPWTAKEFPQLAAWLKANEKPLAVVVEATRRPDYFNPLVAPKADKGFGRVMSANLSGVAVVRGLANALVIRATQHVNERRFDEAWQDLLACHRLGRLVGRGGSLIEGLVGLAIEQLACAADLVLIEHSRPDAKQVQTYVRELRALPPLPAMADQMELGERFMMLDTILMVSQSGLGGLDGGSGDDLLTTLMLRNINWDTALKTANEWYDRIAAAMRIKDRPERTRQLSALAGELTDLKKNSKPGRWSSMKIILGGSRLEAGKRVSGILVSALMPAFRKVQAASDRAEQSQRNLQVAFALAAYRHDHGRYPQKLAELAPKYLAQVPDDLFTGKGVVYKPDGKGYLMYSLGPNGKDEDGRGFFDQPAGDDLRVRVPALAEK